MEVTESNILPQGSWAAGWALGRWHETDGFEMGKLRFSFLFILPSHKLAFGRVRMMMWLVYGVSRGHLLLDGLLGQRAAGDHKG